MTSCSAWLNRGLPRLRLITLGPAAAAVSIARISSASVRCADRTFRLRPPDEAEAPELREHRCRLRGGNAPDRDARRELRASRAGERGGGHEGAVRAKPDEQHVGPLRG